VEQLDYILKQVLSTVEEIKKSQEIFNSKIKYLRDVQDMADIKLKIIKDKIKKKAHKEFYKCWHITTFLL
jgi:chaperonin cofactor prefoldin